jgi:uncharacterized protein YbjT (DUF2867 family)
MRVLGLGGTGFIGSRLCALLQGSGWATPVSASARRLATGVESVRVDTCDRAALRSALRGVDAVVNCVAGGADSGDGRLAASARGSADTADPSSRLSRGTTGTPSSGRESGGASSPDSTPISAARSAI